jgi:hypothetical protein
MTVVDQYRRARSDVVRRGCPWLTGVKTCGQISGLISCDLVTYLCRYILCLQLRLQNQKNDFSKLIPKICDEQFRPCRFYEAQSWVVSLASERTYSRTNSTNSRTCSKRYNRLPFLEHTSLHVKFTYLHVKVN